VAQVGDIGGQRLAFAAWFLFQFGLQHAVGQLNHLPGQGIDLDIGVGDARKIGLEAGCCLDDACAGGAERQ
jgi:hypothetical protein